MKIIIISTLVFIAFTQVQARACTLKDAQDQFSTLNKLFLIYRGEREAFIKQGNQIPNELTVKEGELTKTTATIRKLFAIDVEKKSDMQASDPVDTKICDLYNRLMETHAGGLEIKRTVTVALPLVEQEKQPVCHKNTIRKRFGIAVRKQRKLTIAGKINRKEQISYLKIATKFVENAKNDFDKACRNLHDYEKHLAAEKSDQPEG